MSADCKAGDRIRLTATTDPYTRLRPGALGTVRYVDGLGTVHAAWDPDGHVLGLVPGVDVFEIVEPEQGPGPGAGRVS